MRGKIHRIEIHRADDFDTTVDAQGRWTTSDAEPDVVVGKVAATSDVRGDYRTLSATAYLPPQVRNIEVDDEVVVSLAGSRLDGRYRVASVQGGIKVLALNLERFERKDGSDAQ